MVRRESVASFAFRILITCIKAQTHMSSSAIMPIVGLVDWQYSSTTDTSEVLIVKLSRVSHADINRHKPI